MRPRNMSDADLYDWIFAEMVVEASDGCQIWQGKSRINDYGRIHIGKRQLYLHRWVYQHTHPEEDVDGKMIRHTCPRAQPDKACINPEHLASGSAADNANDLLRNNVKPNQKLTAADVVEMRRLYANGNHRIVDLAALWKVSNEHARQIVKRQMWRYAEEWVYSGSQMGLIVEKTRGTRQGVFEI